jgi:glucosylglycerate phosphorylase
MAVSIDSSTIRRVRQLLIQREADGYLRGIYTENQWAELEPELHKLPTILERLKPESVRRMDETFRSETRLDQSQVVLSGYLDHVRPTADQSQVGAFVAFFNAHLQDLFSHVHVLPHFTCPVIHPELEGPSRRADGGFEPTSFRMDPYYGSEAELRSLGASMMFDFVLNHLSSKGAWFQKFLADEPGYERFFVEVSPDLDWSQVTRPRTHDPVQPFVTPSGKTKYVWCTFSATQADLNYRNPKVFAAIVRAFAEDFVGEGATWVRLDAVAYLVKMFGTEPREPRTTCCHIEETHQVIQAINALFRDLSPSLTLIAEVNDTRENIDTYYGDRDGRPQSEAHLAYAFPCAPLSLAAIYDGDGRAIEAWARSIRPERPVLSFVASHDGIGVTALDSFVSADDPQPNLRERFLAEIQRRGGQINFRSRNIDGRQRDVPYEVCVTLLEAALSADEREAVWQDCLEPEAVERICARIIAIQSFKYVVPHSVPVEYFGGLTGLLGDEALAQATDHRRNRNRGVLDGGWFQQLRTAPLNSHQRLVSRAFELTAQMIRVRRQEPAFSPVGKARVGVLWGAAPGNPVPVTSFLRIPPDAGPAVLALTNTSEQPRVVTFESTLFGPRTTYLRDLLSNRKVGVRTDGLVEVTLTPYEVCWWREGVEQ